ncbi:MAG: Gfo/Idh/MocA family oxidoreductase [Pirellulaceae bacterium]|jgi:predicted dehydrogenase|nr:Gfo/Idh/MocA family oxidoreductase [Pirellulaceae bacterium]
MTDTDRRQFLKTTATAAGTALAAAPAVARSPRSPNDTIRVGLLGMGGRMASHVAALLQMADENVEIVAICDCDQNQLGLALERYPELKDKKVKQFSDMREMFEDPSIDAVSNALGDRWHALSTIWACQAGKDSYVEKPGTHNMFEGRQMVAAARKYDCIVQHGTQNRSSPNIMEGIAKLKEGVIGDVYTARGLDYKIRGNLGRVNPTAVPDGLDWDQWLGPKPLREYSQFWHKRWYWNLELSSGCFANQAVHEMDILRWGLGIDNHPTQVSAMGGNFVHQDDRTSPTHVAITYKFGEEYPLVSYEHRSWYTNSEAGFRDKFPFVQPDYPVGTIFFGSEGYMIIPDYSSYHTFLGLKGEPGPSKADETQTMADLPHFQNWVAAIRARDHKLLNADIAEGHKSMAMCLLARTAFQVGRPLQFDPETELVIGDDEANDLLNKPSYREPYVVPTEV